MTVAARRETRVGVAEGQEWVEGRPDEERWELLDGEPMPMSPPKARHQRIVANLVRALDDLAQARGCDA